VGTRIENELVAAGSEMLVTNSVTLHRRDDTLHEIREMCIYTLISPCELWESIQFLHDEHQIKRGRLNSGSLSQMEAKHAEHIAELQEQGFAICEPTTP
jgi:hypothetical protein